MHHAAWHQWRCAPSHRGAVQTGVPTGTVGTRAARATGGHQSSRAIPGTADILSATARSVVGAPGSCLHALTLQPSPRAAWRRLAVQEDGGPRADSASASSGRRRGRPRIDLVADLLPQPRLAPMAHGLVEGLESVQTIGVVGDAGLPVVAGALAVEGPAIDLLCTGPAGGAHVVEPALDQGGLAGAAGGGQLDHRCRKAIGPGGVEAVRMMAVPAIGNADGPVKKWAWSATDLRMRRQCTTTPAIRNTSGSWTSSIAMTPIANAAVTAPMALISRSLFDVRAAIALAMSCSLTSPTNCLPR